MATTKNTYTGNNSTTDYSFTFPYLKQTDIKVSLDNVVKTLTTDYTFANATTVSFNSAPATDVAIAIYRSTDDSNLVATFYPGSAIRSSDLNDNYTQNLYSTQENTNDATEALDNSRVLESGSYVSAITKATNAVTTANTADTNATAAVSTANTASASATSAVNTANTASTNATNAVTTANAATTTANAADTKADTAITDSASAVTTANTASTNASNAVTTANSASTTANTADTNATAAVSTANTASTNASNAVTTANAASAAVGNALIYTLKDNKTAFEAVTFDASDGHEAWEITDSTGISSSYTSFTDNGGSGTAKTVSGVPSGFTGDSGLSARFTYVHGDNTFTWAGYWVNDAETRYVVLGPATGSAPQSTSTTAANLPVGTTAQRPGTPAAGMFRYNTTESEFEGYDGSAWGEIGGGIVTLDGGNFDNGTSLVNTTEIYDGGDFDS